ncbi:MAG: amidase [Chromatiales bacterium]|jgi:amidase|nr:amidase [Chromatiales bacterium]
MSADSSLIEKSATDIVSLLRAEEVSPLDLLDTLEERIGQVDGIVNALPTQCMDRARRHAQALLTKPVDQRGILAGLPIAIKDLAPVEGVRCTWGSSIFSDFIPTASDCMVDMIEAEGGVIYAKTNTPEFGAGANTFNEVFGRTLNPWDTSKSCAGSSGGSAVALATGTAWLANGSDLGGSLRNPASFCSVVGFRPSPGRVAHGASRPGAFPISLRGMPNDPFSVNGPMARSVIDVGLFLDAMVGEHPGDLISLPRDGVSFFEAARARRAPKRVAFSPDLGITPVDKQVVAICEAAAKRFEDLGCIVEEAHPDFSGVEDIFQTNRAISYYVSKSGLLEHHRDQLKPEVIWNIERAKEVTVDDIARVEIARSAYTQRTREFLDTYDVLLSPATIVPPYPIEQRFVEECNGHTFGNYIQWCSIAYAITVTGFPCMSLPAGFTDDGLPVGLQIVGGPRGEAALLSAAAAYEEAAGLANRVPIDPRAPAA